MSPFKNRTSALSSYASVFRFAKFIAVVKSVMAPFEICFCFAGKCAPKQRFSSFRINFDRAVVILDRGVKLAEAHSKRAACDISFEALRIVFDCVAKILQRSIDIAARKAFVSAIGEFVWRRQIVRGVNCGDANGEN
jgi:hypothetical protein